MIITNLIGGFGNQIFQFAAGLATARATSQTLRFTSDGFNSYALHHGLHLDQAFELSLEYVSDAALRQCIGAWRSPVQLRRIVARMPWLQGENFLVEPSPSWWPELRTRCRHGAYLHGYWQSERYFDDHKPALRAALRWRRPLEGRNAEISRAIAAADHSISLHVRRGDYLANKKNKSIYASCTPEYYIAAVERLAQRTGAQAPTVFAFSDDPAWVMQVLAPRIPGLVFVDHNRAAASWLDMQLMSQCRHHIIANSSFSWWGAWLDARADTQVIAPASWYANGLDDSDLVPSGWHRL